MAFVNASLLIGSLLVAIPIILHLTMRQRPKRIVFPAIRFVLPRRESNTRKLQIRRWLLLALRCAAILLLALALARPSVASQLLGAWLTVGVLGGLALLAGVLALLAIVGQRGRWLIAGLAALAAVLAATSGGMAVSAISRGPVGFGGTSAPVAAVLAFDTSPRMMYRHENKTRLEQAGETAQWLIGQLPSDSEVAVIDSQTRAAVFSVDPSAAAQAAERLQVSYVPRSMPAVVTDAIQLARTSPKTHKEVYIFTDLAAAAWPESEMSALKRLVEEQPDISLFVVDVGIERPVNVALGDVRLSAEVLPRDGELLIETVLRSENVAAERVVEVLVEEPDPSRPVILDGEVLLPEARQRDRTSVELKPGTEQGIQFRVRGLDVGVHHGRVRVLGQDGLPVDDERYFTVEVQQAWPVLLAAPEQASMRFVAEALAPYDLRVAGAARFDCVQTRIDQLLDQNLRDFAAVVLLDPPPLDDDVWNALADYVREGGGLAVMLGSHAQSPEAFDSEAARQLLAGTLARQWRAAEREVFLAPQDYQHPVTSAFREIAASTPWSSFPVFRHWVLDPLADDAHVIVRYSNQQAALVERLVGRGKVVTMTTPLSDPARPPGRVPWNEFTFGENPWPQFILVNELAMYLVSSGEGRLNYLVGQAVSLPNWEAIDPDRYQLFPPLGDAYDVLAADELVTVRFTDAPGAYRLKGNRGGVVLRGFSANVPSDATRMERIDTKLFEESLGNRYAFVRERQQIERAQGRERAGREVYPLLMVALAVILGLEHVLANRFYRQQEA